jgi:hypothetical protein
MRANIMDFNAVKVEVSMVYIKLCEKDYSLT